MHNRVCAYQLNQREHICLVPYYPPALCKYSNKHGRNKNKNGNCHPIRVQEFWNAQSQGHMMSAHLFGKRNQTDLLNCGSAVAGHIPGASTCHVTECSQHPCKVGIFNQYFIDTHLLKWRHHYSHWNAMGIHQDALTVCKVLPQPRVLHIGFNKWQLLVL